MLASGYRRFVSDCLSTILKTGPVLHFFVARVRAYNPIIGGTRKESNRFSWPEKIIGTPHNL
jgi:hypothetical protein